MIREPHPEHAAARLLMDKLAMPSGMSSGQALIKYLDGLAPDSPALKFIGEAIAASVPQAAQPPADAAPPEVA